MKSGKTYVAMGDSTTWTAATTGEDLYASLVRKQMGTLGHPIKLINKGYGGQNSTDMWNFLDWQALNIDADLYTICVGMNDCNNQAVSVSNYTTNMNNIIQKIQRRRPDAEIVLCNIMPTADGNRTPYVANYRSVLAGLPSTYNIYWCDWSNAYSGSQFSTYTYDGIVHPNTAGHSLLFNNFLLNVLQTTNFYKNW